MSNPTRLDPGAPKAAPTRLDPPPPSAPEAVAIRYALPASLRERYRLIEELPAGGSEADLILVEPRDGGERLMLKLYRKGIAPDSELLGRLGQTAAEHVVRLIEHGASDGYAYEVMEYCPYGSLRRLLDGGPLPLDEMREMVAELAGALEEIHTRRILHRDLKPENILVRSTRPLDLVLTDFGISSLRQATQLFTGAARTVKYAAPEALTGVLDEKADWWSLGMIVLEAVSGRHVFDGLSEQVVNHHLATRSIDVSQVFDDDLRKLCRGLLLRDPKQRWGASEVARWLAHDQSLVAPEDSAELAHRVRPYRLGGAECTTVAQLAVALAKNWEDGSKDLQRGVIGEWLVQQLADHNLARKLQDILDLRGVTPDYRLLRFLLAAAPDMPAVWRGKPVTAEGILVAARVAVRDDKEALDWLESIAAENVLDAVRDGATKPTHALLQSWKRGWEEFRRRWEVAHKAQEAWLATPRSASGNDASAYVNIDDLMYSRPLRMAQPSRRAINARLLLAMSDPSLVEAMRAEVQAALADIGEYCPWFASLGTVTQLDAAGVVAARQLLPFARSDAADEKKRLGDCHSSREEHIATLRKRIEDAVMEVVDAGKVGHGELSGPLARFHAACQQVLVQDYAEESYLALKATIEKLLERAYRLGEDLNRLESEEETNAIWFRADRLALAGAAVLGLYWVVGIWLALLTASGLMVFAVVRTSAARAARRGADDAFTAFARQGRMLLRETTTHGH